MTLHRRSFALFVAAALVTPALASCGGSDSSSPSSDSSGVTDSSVATAPVDVFPLTGLPVDDPAKAARPALVAKLDNHPDARPQAGLNKSDIVIEENVEGLTRFAAVFHSDGSDPVGPLRSGRTQDKIFLGSYNKPLFMWSGGNYRVTQVINNSDLVNIGYSASRGKGGYYREKTRRIPHNLYASTTKGWALAPEGSGPPPPQFTYRGVSDATPSTSTPIDGAKVSMYNVKVYWKWDAASGQFLRFTENLKRVLEPHMSAEGTKPVDQVNSKNVVVLYCTYKRSWADRKSPEAQTTGEGEGFVLTNGGMIPIKWARADQKSIFTITDASGAVVRLTPGRTWVELAFKKTVAPVAPGVDPKTVAWPSN